MELAFAPRGVLANSQFFLPITKGLIARSLRLLSRSRKSTRFHWDFNGNCMDANPFGANAQTSATHHVLISREEPWFHFRCRFRSITVPKGMRAVRKIFANRTFRSGRFVAQEGLAHATLSTFHLTNT